MPSIFPRKRKNCLKRETSDRCVYLSAIHLFFCSFDFLGFFSSGTSGMPYAIKRAGSEKQEPGENKKKKIIASIAALVFTFAMTGASFAAETATTGMPSTSQVQEKKADGKTAGKKVSHHKKAKKAKRATNPTQNRRET